MLVTVIVNALLMHVVKCIPTEVYIPTVRIKPTRDFCVNLYPPGYNESHKVKIRHTAIIFECQMGPNRLYLDGWTFIGAAVIGSPRRRFNAVIFQCRINDTPIGYFEPNDINPEIETIVDCPPGKQNTVWYSNPLETTNAAVHWQPNFTLENQHNVTLMVTIIKNLSTGLVFHTGSHIYYPSMRRNKFGEELSSFDSDLLVTEPERYDY